MSIKLIAMDIDDTLITDDLSITVPCQEAIAAAQAQGVRVVLATGRMFSSALPYALQLGLSEPLICYNGAVIQTPRGAEPLFHHPVPLELAQEIVSIGETAGLHVNIYLDDRMYVKEFTDYTRSYVSVGGIEAYPVGDLLSFLRRPPTKVLYVSEPPTVSRWQRELARRYDGRLEVYISKPQYLEFTALGISKGSALQEIAELYGLAPGEVMAIGDSYNDIPMLSYAGIGVAVGNASAAVKKEADHVVASNGESGVAEAIHRFVLP